MYIYCIENKTNNKKYIGLTTKCIKTRFKQHKYAAKNTKNTKWLACAIRKYGDNNFEIYLLDTAYDIIELREKEIYYIKKFDTFNNGYNMTIGGEIFPSQPDMVIVKDQNGNISKIHCEIFHNNKDKYKHVNNGMITIYKEEEKLRVTSEDYRNIYSQDGWKSKNSGFVTVKMNDGTVTKIESESFDKNIHTGINTGKQSYFNILTSIFENLKPDEVNVNIHFNKNKCQYWIFNEQGNLILKINNIRSIPDVYGKSQFNYMHGRFDSSEYTITDDLLNKLKLKNRNYNLLGYTMKIVNYDRDVNKL